MKAWTKVKNEENSEATKTKKFFVPFSLSAILTPPATDNDGDLGLRELLEIQKLEGDFQKSVLTPSLLFRFDMDQDGSLDVTEFDKLMKHLRKEKEKEKRRKLEEKEHSHSLGILHHSSGSNNNNGSEHYGGMDGNDNSGGSGESGSATEVWSVVDQRRAAELNFSRDGDTPLLTGQHGVAEAERANDLLNELQDDSVSSDGGVFDGVPIRRRKTSNNDASGNAGSSTIADNVNQHDDESSSHNSGGQSSSNDDFDSDDPRAAAAPRGARKSPYHRTNGGRRESMRGMTSSRDEDSCSSFGGISESVLREDDEDEDDEDGNGRGDDDDDIGTGNEGSSEEAGEDRRIQISGHGQIEEDVVEDDDEIDEQSTSLGSTPLGDGRSPVLVSSVDSNDSDAAKIILESKKSLSNILSTPQGKKKYMKWLFRLADAQGKGQVNVEELSLILKALSLDGLITNDLTFDDEGHSSSHHGAQDYMEIARRIMKEFDTGKDGVLSEPEFNVLAELIVRKYTAERGSDSNKIVLNRYQIKRILGQGAMGTVKLATNIKSGKSVAIKMIDSSQVQDFSKIDLEIKAMLILRHPNVVRLFKVFESNDKIFLVMELCGGGTLADMVRIKPLSESLARFYMRQLIPAIKYCHEQGIIHRDIKLENLLLTNRGNLKISDFGHAGIYRKGWDLFSTSLVGSLWHISPEQVNGTVYKGSRVDIWALGVVLYRLLSGGRPPFYSDVVVELLDMIKEARFPPLEHVTSEANDLMNKILVVDPDKRLSLRAISEHPWMKYGQETVPRLEAIDLILSDVTDVEKQWEAMCKAARELQIVFTVPMEQERRMEIHRMKCHFPASELKFTITEMRVSESRVDPPFFEFVIRKGETSELQNIVEQLRKTFKATLAKVLGLPFNPSKSLSKGSLTIEQRRLLAVSATLGDSSPDQHLQSSSEVTPTSSLHSSHYNNGNDPELSPRVSPRKDTSPMLDYSPSSDNLRGTKKRSK